VNPYSKPGAYPVDFQQSFVNPYSKPGAYPADFQQSFVNPYSKPEAYPVDFQQSCCILLSALVLYPTHPKTFTLGVTKNNNHNTLAAKQIKLTYTAHDTAHSTQNSELRRGRLAVRALSNDIKR
jgi:hypothetical protein